MAAAKRAPTAFCMHCTLCLDIVRLQHPVAVKCACNRSSGGLDPSGKVRVQGPAVLLGLDAAAIKRAAVDKRGAGMWWIVAKERPE